MATNAENSKRIAKNTFVLYIRTIIILLISLYTSRVILNTLGVEDYGINSVVGGLVLIFGAISGSLSTSISRYITYEIGRGDFSRLRTIFSTSINIQIGLALIIWVLGEIIGVWFLNTKMNIPEERMIAANWVLQCTLVSFVIGLISMPYNAAIVAHEKMTAFAYISLLEAVLKLVIVYMLLISSYDKLITFAILQVCVALLIRIIYGMYCNRHFDECHYHFVWDKPLIKEMTNFAGWNFFGNTAFMLNVQGVNMLINIYFGVTMNAARGVATQVQSAVMNFVSNFTMAVNPQITKSYAAGDMSYLYSLVCKSAKYSAFLMLIFTVPIVCEAEYLLRLWLKIVPDYAPIFLRLTLGGSLMTILGNSMLTSILATGNIRNYEIWITLAGFLVFPLTWIAYECCMSVTATYWIYIVVYFMLNFVRLYFAKKLLDFPVMMYIKEAILRVLIVSVVSFILPLVVINLMETSFLRLIVSVVVGVASTMTTIYICGMADSERKKIINAISNYKKKYIR